MCVYYYDYLYVFYMLQIGQRTFKLMFPVYRDTDENKVMYLTNSNKITISPKKRSRGYLTYGLDQFGILAVDASYGC